MGLDIVTRASDSPWIDSVWTCTADDDVTTMTSVATVNWGLVFWRYRDRFQAALTGPELTAGTAPVPSGARFVGIEFAVGTSPRNLPVQALVGSGVELPDTTGRDFRLDGSRWSTPGADDAEALVARLVRVGTVVRDPIVTAAATGRAPNCSPRTIERRYRAATGLTPGTVRQIRRAREAATRLASGAATVEVVTRLGYCDEPHLARALRRFVGHPARRLRDGLDGAIGLDLTQPPTW